eukprot:3343-Heterococcus_DN1.PRE.1
MARHNKDTLKPQSLSYITSLQCVCLSIHLHTCADKHVQERAFGVRVKPECVSDSDLQQQCNHHNTEYSTSSIYTKHESTDSTVQQYRARHNAEHTDSCIHVKAEITDDNEQQYWAGDTAKLRNTVGNYLKAEMPDGVQYAKVEQQFDDTEQQQCADCNSTYCTCHLNGHYAGDDSGSDSGAEKIHHSGVQRRAEADGTKVYLTLNIATSLHHSSITLEGTVVRLHAHVQHCMYRLRNNTASDDASGAVHKQANAIKNEARQLRKQHASQLKTCVKAYIDKLAADTRGEFNQSNYDI